MISLIGDIIWHTCVILAFDLYMIDRIGLLAGGIFSVIMTAGYILSQIEVDDDTELPQ